jgi:hypothetical protein
MCAPDRRDQLPPRQNDDRDHGVAWETLESTTLMLTCHAPSDTMSWCPVSPDVAGLEKVHHTTLHGCSRDMGWLQLAPCGLD